MERILLAVLLGLLGYLTFLVFSPFLQPLAWAIVLTITFFPWHRRIGKLLKGPNRAALATTLLLALLILGPGLTVLGVLGSQAADAVKWVRAEWEAGRLPFGELLQYVPADRILDWFAEYNIQPEDLRAYVTEKLQNLAGFIAGQLGRLAGNLFIFLAHLFVTLFATFYLLRDGPALFERFRRALPLEPVQRDHLLTTAQNVLYASVFSGIVVAAVQGFLGGMAFWILGIGAPVLWGTVMGFLSLLPVLGAWIVWVPAVVFFLLKAQYVKAVILLLVGAGIVGMVDNVLRPVLISGRAQLNGLLVFISILGGVAAFGLLGIILGPIVVALGAAVVEAYTEPPAAPAPAPADPEAAPPP